MLFNDRQNVSRVYVGAFVKANFFDDSILRCFQFVLHFHCFNDQNAFTLFDLRTDFDKDADEFAGHRGLDLRNSFGAFVCRD